LQNWPIILQICEEHRCEIENTIYSKVQSIQIKKLAEKYRLHHKPIAVAVDLVQKDACMIIEAVKVWKTLEREVDKAGHSPTASCKVTDCMKQTLTPAHLLATILDPRFKGKTLFK